MILTTEPVGRESTRRRGADGGGRVTAPPARKARRRALELFEAFGVAARRNACPRVFSGGERQRANGPNNTTRTIIGSASVLTLMLAVVASLGVFNTVVLNTHDRRRDRSASPWACSATSRRSRCWSPSYRPGVRHA
ncbi:hypothetical protein ACWDG1_16115 [Streptomyces sp. NPDC001177]